jgi:hypothetical protein
MMTLPGSVDDQVRVQIIYVPPDPFGHPEFQEAMAYVD